MYSIWGFHDTFQNTPEKKARLNDMQDHYLKSDQNISKSLKILDVQNHENEV